MGWEEAGFYCNQGTQGVNHNENVSPLRIPQN
jgi:hypothetical protein